MDDDEFGLDVPVRAFDELAAIQREHYVSLRRAGFSAPAALYIVAAGGKDLAVPDDGDDVDDLE